MLIRVPRIALRVPIIALRVRVPTIAISAAESEDAQSRRGPPGLVPFAAVANTPTSPSVTVARNATAQRTATAAVVSSEPQSSKPHSCSAHHSVRDVAAQFVPSAGCALCRSQTRCTTARASMLCSRGLHVCRSALRCAAGAAQYEVTASVRVQAGCRARDAAASSELDDGPAGQVGRPNGPMGYLSTPGTIDGDYDRLPSSSSHGAAPHS